MLCFECGVELGVSAPASATCSVCGAGVCVDHVIQGYVEEHVRGSLGNPATYRVPGRRMFCHECAPAYLPETGRVTN